MFLQEVIFAETVNGRFLLVLVKSLHGSEGAVATVAVGHATRKDVFCCGYLGRKDCQIDHPRTLSEGLTVDSRKNDGGQCDKQE